MSISVENETSPGELRIENGDILRLQINGRNRTHEDLSGTLLLRMKEGTLLVSDHPFNMPGKPLGGDERRHRLHGMRLRVVRGEPGLSGRENGMLTLPLEPGRRVMQAYLLDEKGELAYGSRTLHFESEPAQTQGGMPFEPFQVRSGTPPMWELRMEESKLHFAADYPLHTALLQSSTHDSSDGHNPFELEINVNGLLQWALEPLLEDEADPTRVESLREAKPELVDDEAWDWYMDCLSELAAEMTNSRHGQSISPIDFALKWRKTGRCNTSNLDSTGVHLMPVLIWSDRDNALGNSIRTGRRYPPQRRRISPRSRSPGQRAGRHAGHGLACAQSHQRAQKWQTALQPPSSKSGFWGRAIHVSQIMRHEAMQAEERTLLFQALTAKAWHGIRSDLGRDPRWRELIPAKKKQWRTRTDDRRLDRAYDFLEVGYWLRDQQLHDAGELFGWQWTNARKLYVRPTLRSSELRESLLYWLRRQSPVVRDFATSTDTQLGFISFVKALRKRFPASGPRLSAAATALPRA